MEKPVKYRRLVRATILSIVAILFLTLIVYRCRNRAAFNKHIAKLSAAGFPVSLADLEADYVLPEGVENAADVYLKAFSVYAEPNDVEKKLLPVSGSYRAGDDVPPYPQEVLDAIRMSLEKNRECLELLDKAARMEHCLFPRTQEGFWFSRDYLNPLKKTAQILTERNLFLAQTQQTDALFESTQTCIGLTNALSKKPQLIDYLITIAIEAMFASGLEDSLNLTRLSEEQLSILQHQSRCMSQTNTFASGLIVERTGMIDSVRSPANEVMEYFYGYSSFSSKLKAQIKAIYVLYVLSGLKDEDSAVMLDFYEKQIKIAGLPFHQQPAELKKFDKELQSYSRFHFGLYIAADTYSHISKINLRVIGQLQCAETALAIERYRLKYKSLPDSLKVLVPEFMDTVFLDPFDGRPIRYVIRDTGGYTVYCIGQDGIDNGGLDRDQMAKKSGTKSVKEYDHPFTVRAFL